MLPGGWQPAGEDAGKLAVGDVETLRAAVGKFIPRLEQLCACQFVCVRPLAGPEALAAEDLTACASKRSLQGELFQHRRDFAQCHTEGRGCFYVTWRSFLPCLPGSSIGRGCAQRPRRLTRREQRCGRGTAGIFRNLRTYFRRFWRFDLWCSSVSPRRFPFVSDKVSLAYFGVGSLALHSSN